MIEVGRDKYHGAQYVLGKRIWRIMAVELLVDGDGWVRVLVLVAVDVDLLRPEHDVL